MYSYGSKRFPVPSTFLRTVRPTHWNLFKWLSGCSPGFEALTRGHRLIFCKNDLLKKMVSLKEAYSMEKARKLFFFRKKKTPKLFLNKSNINGEVHTSYEPTFYQSLKSPGLKEAFRGVAGLLRSRR